MHAMTGLGETSQSPASPWKADRVYHPPYTNQDLLDRPSTLNTTRHQQTDPALSLDFNAMMMPITKV
jgi:hypothetical protein